MARAVERHAPLLNRHAGEDHASVIEVRGKSNHAIVRRLLGGLAITPSSACVSASETLPASTLLKRHKAGAFGDAAHEFAKWNKAAGRVLPGLVRRRAAKAALYESRTRREGGLDGPGNIAETGGNPQETQATARPQFTLG